MKNRIFADCGLGRVGCSRYLAGTSTHAPDQVAERCASAGAQSVRDPGRIGLVGEEIDCVVIGIGINVLKGSVPPADMLQFPATSLEDELGYAPERAEILFDILSNLINLRPQFGTEEFLSRWGESLAFLGEQVQVGDGNGLPVPVSFSGWNRMGVCGCAMGMIRSWQYDLGMCDCVRASNARDILCVEVKNMFDNLR